MVLKEHVTYFSEFRAVLKILLVILRRTAYNIKKQHFIDYSLIGTGNAGANGTFQLWFVP